MELSELPEEGKVDKNANLDRELPEKHDIESEFETTKISGSKSDKERFFDQELKRNRNIAPGTIDKWRKVVIALTWTSILIDIGLATVGFYIASIENSAGEYGFALISFLDAFTSFAVLWRFYGKTSAYSQKKEHITMVVLGGLFVFSAICITAKAVYTVLDVDKQDLSETALNILFATSIMAAISLYILFVLKVFVAKKLLAWTIMTDGLNSLAGAIVATSLIASTKIDEWDSSFWFIDPIIGIAVGVLLAVYGIWALAKYIPIIRRNNTYIETK